MLIGRERELAEMERVLACARGGQSAVLALVGEPGIGKTVLLDYAPGRADSGCFATAEALRFALRRLLAEPLAALLAAREHEPSLLDDAGMPVLRLPGLDRGSSAQLLGPVQPEVAERPYRATAGNPLALLELAADGAHLAVTPVDAPVPVPARIAEVF